GADAFDLTERATATLARAFSLDVPRSTDSPSGTRSLAARRLFEEGLRVFYRGEARPAHDLFVAALGEDSTFAMAAFFAGASRSAFDYEGSHTFIFQAIRLAERAPERDRLLIKLWTQGSDQAVFLPVAESLASRFPAEPDGHLALARARGHAGDFLGSLRNGRRVLDMDSFSLRSKTPTCRACEAYSALVDDYIALDSLAAAERTAREWIRRQPSSHLAWRILSAVLLTAGQHDAALQAFRTAEQIQPSIGARDTRVVLALHAEQFAQADHLLRERLRDDPQDVQALWYLAISLRNQGRIREALATAERHRTSYVERIRAGFARGQALFELERFREAAALFDSVAHLPALSGALTTRGGMARHLPSRSPWSRLPSRTCGRRWSAGA
ncbi:MAG: tetratricopeptide repeat protein, partial [Acidobacteria bacterium]|nr:tetratricopeptide repeat protein [Acidobacteriota bacterium]